MIRKILNRLFGCRKGRIGHCRARVPVYDYIYLDENTVVQFEKFLGPIYDYDARDCCIFVWKDESVFGYWTWPVCIPYGTYVVKVKSGLDISLKVYGRDEFLKLYERL